jgi:vacuolar-type H+-ATPase subunit C/Vma6
VVTGLDALHYAGANARMRGLYADLLSDTVWHDLLAAGNYPIAVSVLRQTSYGDIISESEQSGSPTLEMIERRLWGKTAEITQQAMVLLSGGARTLLSVWWQRFELENLKAIFRGLDQQMEPNAIRRFLIPLGEHSTLAWDTLLHAHSVGGLIDYLRNTHYINPLRNAYPRYQHDGSLFALEIALDIRYYRDLAAAIQRLSGSDRDDARRILGYHLDMLNVLWAFRYRNYYGLSAEEIVNYTLWHTVRTDTDLVRAIALGADPRDIISRVWGDRVLEQEFWPGAGQGPEGETSWLPAMEMSLYRYWRKLARRELTGYPFRLGPTLGYLVLHELEVRDLITLLEGKGMRWRPERIAQHLIRRKE